MAETVSTVTWSLYHLLGERKSEGEPERDKDVTNHSELLCIAWFPHTLKRSRGSFCAVS